MIVTPRKRKMLASGAAVALVAAIGPYALQGFTAWLDHRREMAIIERRAVQVEAWLKWSKRCEDAGGRQWRGDCLGEDGQTIDTEEDEP
jgi:hypothetical protein